MLNKLKRHFINVTEDKDFSEVLKGSATALTYRVFSMMVAYGLMIFISRKLGDHGIGIYNLSLSILMISIMVSCLGFNTSIVRFVSQYNSQGEAGMLKKLYKSVMKFILPLSLASGVILFFLAEYIAMDLYTDPDLVIPLRVLSFIIPLCTIIAINVEFIRGLKIIWISELFRNLGINAITLAFLLIVSIGSLQVYHPLVAYLIGAVIVAIITIGFILRQLSRRSEDPSIENGLINFSMKEHLVVSLPMILTSFVILVNGQVDTLMLGLFENQSIGNVGIYSVALRISVITNFMIGAFKSITMPKISELFWGEKMKVLDEIITKSTRYIFFFAAPVSLILLLFPEEILSLFSSEFSKGSRTLQILAVAQLINASCGLVAVFLNMTGNQLYFTKLVLLTSLANVLLNIILIPSFGMEGAAVATLLTTGTWNILGAIHIFKKYRISTFFRPSTMF